MLGLQGVRWQSSENSLISMLLTCTETWRNSYVRHSILTYFRVLIVGMPERPQTELRHLETLQQYSSINVQHQPEKMTSLRVATVVPWLDRNCVALCATNMQNSYFSHWSPLGSEPTNATTPTVTAIPGCKTSPVSMYQTCSVENPAQMNG
jgi:hypothetical protein